MTQPPRNGPSAPADAESESRPGGAAAANPPAGWGTTSTMDGTPYARADQSRQPGHNGVGAATAPPSHEDAPAQPSGQPGPSTAAPSTAGHSARGSRNRGPRRARLQLRHIDPWTVLKFSCVLSIALFFVWLIVIGVLFGVLDGAGVIDKINNTVTTINGSGAKPPVTAGIVFGSAAIIGVVNIVLFIALSTVGSVVYNLCADLVGGIEVTLSER
jgi:Transmembrane domain of unknown function (DUF3566)